MATATNIDTKYNTTIEELSRMDFSNCVLELPNMSAEARIMMNIIIYNSASKTALANTPVGSINELFGNGASKCIWIIQNDVQFLKDISIATHGFTIKFITDRVFPSEFAHFIIKNQNNAICANYIDYIFYDDSNFMKNGGRLVYDKFAYVRNREEQLSGERCEESNPLSLRKQALHTFHSSGSQSAQTLNLQK